MSHDKVVAGCTVLVPRAAAAWLGSMLLCCCRPFPWAIPVEEMTKRCLPQTATSETISCGHPPARCRETGEVWGVAGRCGTRSAGFPRSVIHRRARLDSSSRDKVRHRETHKAPAHPTADYAPHCPTTHTQLKAAHARRGRLAVMRRNPQAHTPCEHSATPRQAWGPEKAAAPAAI